MSFLPCKSMLCLIVDSRKAGSLSILALKSFLQLLLMSLMGELRLHFIELGCSLNPTRTPRVGRQPPANRLACGDVAFSGRANVIVPARDEVARYDHSSQSAGVQLCNVPCDCCCVHL